VPRTTSGDDELEPGDVLSRGLRQPESRRGVVDRRDEQPGVLRPRGAQQVEAGDGAVDEDKTPNASRAPVEARLSTRR
jgi:hypothetical protein